MYNAYEESMDRCVIAVLDGIDYTTENIQFTENIELIKSEYEECERYCLKFTINEKDIEKIGKSIPVKVLEEHWAKGWQLLPFEEIDLHIADHNWKKEHIN